jgi:U3 small nucleolar RNA-associated protein 11
VINFAGVYLGRAQHPGTEAAFLAIQPKGSFPCTTLQMSKKVFHAREHRERAQPANRARLGLLEKHKDYIERARNFHAKQARLLALRRQASAKNPDEFYFAMQKTRRNKKDGSVRREAAFEKMPTEVIKLLKSQDLGYVRETIRRESHKLHSLKMEHCITEDQLSLPSNGADNDPETAHDQDHSALNSVSAKRIRFIEDDEDLAEIIIETGVASAENDASSRHTHNMEAITEYRARSERLRLLRIAERKLATQTADMSRGRKRKIREDENGIPVYKWDQERKK